MKLFPDHKSMTRKELEKAYDDAISLIDGAFEIVALYPYTTPGQLAWKKEWMESARKHGASYDC